ncbi:FkbM family methyltransferase [Janthinobacterium sp.]|uniref:FkbM family methyltransferase n=1 Tax=Janthinobacterium sp. TaxID=1871054 RepID=UPI00293D4010|nr:FkbM family methyltransferase [Janthinobacterium sp.]
MAHYAKASYALHGITMPVDRKIMSNVVVASLMNGSFERPEALLLGEKLRKDDRILELGGGLGLISAMSAKIADQGTVVTVEANVDIIGYLRRVHEINHTNVEIINSVVVGMHTKSKLPFYVREDFWSSSLSVDPRNFSMVREVDVVAIAELVDKHRPTVVICDIEGGEIDLIEANWTKGVRLVMMEVHPSSFGKIGLEKICSFLTGNGFEVKLKKDLLTASRHSI